MTLDEILRSAGRRTTLPCGATVFREGQTCEHLPWLERGRVRILRTAASGREGALYSVAAGDLCAFATACTLHDLPYPGLAVVAEDVDAFLVPAAVFRQLVASNEAVRTAALASLARGLVGLVGLFEATVFRAADERLAAYLLEQARTSHAGNGPMALEATHDWIAADLWTAREVVSRLLKRFEREGLVTTERGRVVLGDRTALERRAGRNP